jgi:NAD+ synthase (glutamine-hydrolysing)
MKIATVQLNYTIGDVPGNFAKAQAAVDQAAKDKPDLIVVTEMCTTGYPPKDLLHREDLIEQNEKAVAAFAHLSERLNCTIAFGYVQPNPDSGGNPFFNAGLIVQNGKPIKVRRKVLLPTYDVFAEDRYFEPPTLFSEEAKTEEFLWVKIGDKKVALLICEEIWNRDQKLYPYDPVKESVRLGANYLCIINASPFREGVLARRHELVAEHCIKHGVGAVYVNQWGYNDNVGFDGASFAMNDKGEIIWHAPDWRDDVSIFDTDSKPIPKIVWEQDWQNTIVSALKVGINDYMDKIGIPGPAIVCNSGGIDSALVLTLAAMARGKGNVLSIGLPSEFSSDHSVSDASKLAKKLGVRHIVVSIKDIHAAIRASVDDGLASGLRGEGSVEAGFQQSRRVRRGG